MTGHVFPAGMRTGAVASPHRKTSVLLVSLRLLLFRLPGARFPQMLSTSAYCGPSVAVTSNVDWNWEEILENNARLPLADLILIYNLHVRVITRKIFFSKRRYRTISWLSFYVDGVICPFRKSSFLSNYFRYYVTGADYFRALWPFLMTRIHLEENACGGCCPWLTPPPPVRRPVRSSAEPRVARKSRKIGFQPDPWVRLARKIVLLLRKHLFTQTRFLGDSTENSGDVREHVIAKCYIW